MTPVDILVKGALLHDIGKVCQRAKLSGGTHSEIGVRFLKEFLPATDEAKELLDCLRYHHSSALGGARLRRDSLAYIVYEADNIAAGADRRKLEDEAGARFDNEACLQSVFNIFSGEAPTSRYRLRNLDPDKEFNYPTGATVRASSGDYMEITEALKANFRKPSVLDMSVSELLRILEDTMSFVPSSTDINEACDISLYVHCKVAAAVAACLYQYLAEAGDTDFKKRCLDGNKALRAESSYLLVSGDLSGIQNFIYTIPSKGAMKSLRGRSFYLELFLENFADELLAALGLSRANLLYSGGGHFYVLAANTEKTRRLLEELKESCNAWMLERFGTQLYLALGYSPCTGEDLLESGAQRSAFAAVSRRLSEDKLCRYSAARLEELFDSESRYNKALDGLRECAVCHMSSKGLKKIDGLDGDVCDTCGALFALGACLFDKDTVLAVLDRPAEQGEGGLEIYGHQRPLYLAVLKKDSLEKYKGKAVRLYSKNEAATSRIIGTNLWLADHLARDAEGNPLEFGQLADLSCGEERGIRRLGVLRADVDNLGAAFIGGFLKAGAKDPYRFATLSRHADLSRDLSLFFKLAVTKLCGRDLKGLDFKPFSLFGLEKSGARKVHIVYSGGDDMFIVGAWDDLLELAIDIRRAFRRFTNGKLSFSAGLALFRPGFPISKMAELTGELEAAAKKIPGKDSLALFGFETEQAGRDEALGCRHIYKWGAFIDKVWGEKLKFCLSHFDLDGRSKDKLTAGKSLLYRLMELTEDGGSEGKLNLARFAYTLARLQPVDPQKLACYNELAETMYAWFKKDEDRRQLLTALHLLVYYLRDDKEA